MSSFYFLGEKGEKRTRASEREMQRRAQGAIASDLQKKKLKKNFKTFSSRALGRARLSDRPRLRLPRKLQEGVFDRRRHAVRLRVGLAGPREGLRQAGREEDGQRRDAADGRVGGAGADDGRCEDFFFDVVFFGFERVSVPFFSGERRRERERERKRERKKEKQKRERERVG